MECVEIGGLTFSYPGAELLALDGVSFSVHKGEFLTLTGPSGCGKSTLLRHLKPALTPSGTAEGSVLFFGKPLMELDKREQAARIGFVSQSPENQVVTDKVWHELAFGLESLGLDTPAIRARVAEMASFFGIQTWFHMDVSELSGGQKQLLSLASVMVTQPELLILDEPTSQLDPIAASDFLTTVGRINRELGTTVVMTEHRLEEVFPMSDRVVCMEAGRVAAIGTPKEVGELLKEKRSPMFLGLPTPMRVYAAVESGDDCPVTVREGRAWLENFSKNRWFNEIPPESIPERGALAAELREVWFRYEKSSPDVLRGLSLKIFRGELLAVLGGNGAGKSTAIKLLSGLAKPYRGRVSVSGTVAALPQDPLAVFVRNTVKGDLEDMSKSIDGVVALCRLETLLERHPCDLSGGERQRAALAKVLLAEPEILLLDEPTKGLDAGFKREFAEILQKLTEKGVAVVMVSHDVEFCAACAHRCAMFFDGAVASENTPRAFFSGNSFYTTAANRMAREKLPEAVTAGDLIFACGGRAESFPTSGGHRPARAALEAPVQKQAEKRRLPTRTILALAMLLLAIPLTIYAGYTFFDNRKYYFISLLVIFETMLPFFFVFERRRPQARELVLLAVMCAIGVAGRAAFYMVPNFTPVMAVVIITGAAFGGEAGFLVGAMTMFVSNFFMGQGPWTPWQMFSMGVAGFIAGLIFRRGEAARKRLPMCVFGGLATLVIYGGLMNPASVLMYQTHPGWGMILAAYATGFPVDCVHAASTVIFLWLFSRPMLEKLDRAKLKYGLIEI